MQKHNVPKLAILHDYFLYKGGGERLVISLAKHLGADVITAFVAKDAFDPRNHGIHTTELSRENTFSKIPGFRYLTVQLSFLLKTGFLKNYDTILYSGDCLTALLRARKKRNIGYMHTPPRHLYDAYHERLAQYPLWKKMIFIPFVFFNRWRFETLSKHLDLIITNSKNTQKRIKKYLGLESMVVYPPCTTLPFKNLEPKDYYFSWARLYPIKRVHKIVEAFIQMPEKKLIVASGGPQENYLRKLAEGKKNIEITGWIDDKKLLDYLGKCIATIYIPIREDFGMSPVESMASGKPVIGVAEGGMLEVIDQNKNGVMLKPNFTQDDLIKTVREMTPQRAKAMEQACYETAKKFSEEKFLEEMEKILFQ